MKRSQPLLLFFVALLTFPAVAHAQAWSGILSPSRATDWTRAGISGGLPSSRWTQCGSTITAYSGDAATITNALSSCGGQNKYVLLGAGTFHISSGQIKFPTSGHVALRGMGANSTFIVSTGASGSCSQLSPAVICGISSDGSYSSGNPPTYNWTSGYSQGSSQITLSSVANITPNSTLLFLDQCEDGYTGSPCAGSNVDNGQMYVCQDKYAAGTRPTGCSNNGGDGATRLNRGQEQIVVATSIAGNVVTISSPLAAPNWRAGQNPQVWIVQSIAQVGVENLAIDMLNSSAAVGVEFSSAYQWWISGVKIAPIRGKATNAFQTAYGIVKDSYFAQSLPVSADVYATRLSDTSFILIQNNIYEQVFAPIVFDGADTGSVIAYNFDINNTYPSDFMRGWAFNHNINEFQLYEGNVANQQVDDGNHGIADMITQFRNFFTGWESCGNGQCGTQAFKDAATATAVHSGSRYENFVGNVLGTPGVTIHYNYSGSDYNIFVFGPADGSASIPADPLSASTSLRWGNYDVVTAAVRWCGNSSDTGWITTCASTSEVPAGISPYPNLLPTLGDTGVGQGSMPASFYLPSKPSWFGSTPWPPIGPDVSGGNVGQCSGIPLANSGTMALVAATTNAQCIGTSLTIPAWGGHINANPAMNCALNVMGMPPDGSGGVLSFNASACYGGSSSSGPNPPGNLTVVVN